MVRVCSALRPLFHHRDLSLALVLPWPHSTQVARRVRDLSQGAESDARAAAQRLAPGADAARAEAIIVGISCHRFSTLRSFFEKGGNET